MEKVDTAREQALKIIMKVFDDKSYSNILIKNLGNSFTALDRAFITELVYGIIKWKLKIDNIISQMSSIRFNKISSKIINILRLGIYQIDFMDKVPESAAVDECVKLAKKYSNPGASKYVNALLRNYIRNHNSIVYPNKEVDSIKFLSVYYSYPEWLVEQIISEFGLEFTEEFLKASNGISPLTARVNKLKTDKYSLKTNLLSKGVEVYDSKYVEDAVILRNVPRIDYLEEFQKGYFTIQDESSMLAALILTPEPEELIIDVCSAPGTKSSYIAELMGNKGTIISGDISSSKLRLVDENAKRLGIDIIHTVCNNAEETMIKYENKANRVLVDVPCSGFGIMRKKPEIRWNRTKEEIKEILKIQENILNASCKYLKPGGVIVYSTCTILHEENIIMINNFLNNHKNFIREDITSFIPDKLSRKSLKDGYIELYPSIEGIDGFFIARLKKVE